MVAEILQKTLEASVPSVLITGSNRGIGLAWARHFAQEKWRVFATCRHPCDATELHALAKGNPWVSVHRLDVTIPEDVCSLYWELEGEPLDILLSNAGVYLEKGMPSLDAFRYDDWLRTFEVNTLGGIRLAEALVANLAWGKRKLAVFTSSHMGSIADIGSPGSYYYRSSKAALNATARGLARELEPRGIGVLILHPGGVRTRMGPRDGLTPEESVAAMRRVIDRFRLADSGRFYCYDGSELPW